MHVDLLMQLNVKKDIIGIMLRGRLVANVSHNEKGTKIVFM